MHKPKFEGRVGEIRPSQLMFSYGVGASVDLPQITVLVMGLDDWPLSQMGANEVSEERLRLAVRQATGAPIERLLLPPPRPDDAPARLGNPDDKVGIPVAPFPRWMRCPRCNKLAPVESGLFDFKPDSFRPDRARYVHLNCSKSKFAPTVLPARFLVACENGHLDDFPWIEYVHSGTPCNAPQLELFEVGTAGNAASINVTCKNCGAYNNMGRAFEHNNDDKGKGGYQFSCRGRHPHLRSKAEGCQATIRPILLGASNAWFPITLSAFSIPGATDALGQLVEENWALLDKVTSLDVLKAFRLIGKLNAFAAFDDDDELMGAIEAQRAGSDDEASDLLDLKTPEWEVFSHPAGAPENADFKLREVGAPQGFEDIFERTVLVERLREVHSLLGFTRIESPRDFDDISQLPPDRWVPLSRNDEELSWLPTVEVRGEGIFLQLRESALQAWLSQPEIAKYDEVWQRANARWRASRGLEMTAIVPQLMWARYVLLHSLSHALMRQICLECGYSSASVRERIYWQEADVAEGKEAMAGLLIYTAAPDAEGTLGGLVALGEPESLGYHLRSALEEMRLCASDPICAEHRPGDGLASEQMPELHGSACHACGFAPETSCERGNKFLDRSVLVETFDAPVPPFFGGLD